MIQGGLSVNWSHEEYLIVGDIRTDIWLEIPWSEVASLRSMLERAHSAYELRQTLKRAEAQERKSDVP